MPVKGDPIPDAAMALLARALPALGWQLAAAPPGDLAALVCDAAVPWPSAAAGHELPRGHRCALLPRADVRALAGAELAPALDGPTGPGQVWCLLLWHDGERPRVLVVPVSPTARAPRARARRGLA